MLGLGHYATAAAPGSAHRFVFELEEDSCRLLRLLPLVSRLLQSIDHLLFQQAVARHSEYILHAMSLAPAHQLFAAEAGIAAQNNFYLGPGSAYPSHNALDLGTASFRGIDIARPQGRTQDILRC